MSEITTGELVLASIQAALKAKETVHVSVNDAIAHLANSQVYALIAEYDSVPYNISHIVDDPRTYLR